MQIDKQQRVCKRRPSTRCILILPDSEHTGLMQTELHFNVTRAKSVSQTCRKVSQTWNGLGQKSLSQLNSSCWCRLTSSRTPAKCHQDSYHSPLFQAPTCVPSDSFQMIAMATGIIALKISTNHWTSWPSPVQTNWLAAISAEYQHQQSPVSHAPMRTRVLLDDMQAKAKPQPATTRNVEVNHLCGRWQALTNEQSAQYAINLQGLKWITMQPSHHET